MKDNPILVEEFEQIEDGDLMATIDFFKQNEESLLSKTSTELDEIEYIYIDYLVALYEKSRYSRIIEIIEKLENSNEVEEYRKSDLEFDEDIRFYKYSSFFSKKNYKESKAGFKELVKDYPENEDYQNWLIDSKTRISNDTFGFIMLSTGGLMLLALIIQLYLKSPLLKSINYILEGLFLVSFLLLIIDLRRKRKIN
ncbi:hypothetical protein [Ancylomarina sp.]|uniref:hypothetical protein n=1 Tax=Ancylomarina sp. TaxID=1970196 RepID=UPI003561C01F